MANEADLNSGQALKGAWIIQRFCECSQSTRIAAFLWHLPTARFAMSEEILMAGRDRTLKPPTYNSFR